MFEDAWKAVESLEFGQSDANEIEDIDNPLYGTMDDSKFVYSKVLISAPLLLVC